MKKENSEFGRVMKAARREKHLTREALGHCVGKSPRYIAALENEGQSPSYETMHKIIRALGIDANMIFYPENPADSDEMGRVIRLIKECDSRQLSVVAATVEAVLKLRADQS